MKRVLFAIAAGVLASASPALAEIKVTDVKGREVRLEKPAERVVLGFYYEDFLAVVGFSDDIAVLTAAFAAISGQIKDDHYIKADDALRDEVPEAAR